MTPARSFKKPKKFDYNLIVIGGGSAGLVSAYLGATLKAKVALIEKHKMGGDCLNTGCVPSKALIRTAKVLSLAHRASEFGLKSAHFEFEFSEVMKRIQRVIRKIEPHDSIERYTRLGVDCISGQAHVRTPYEVEVNGQLLTTRSIIVATGARPFVPPIDGISTIDPLTSDNIWNLNELPQRLVVLGGGPIGCELAQSFARLGSQVTIVEKNERILPREDEEVSQLVSQRFKAEGIVLLTSHAAKQITHHEKTKHLITECKEESKITEFDELIVAVGRKANVEGFGLEELGVRLNPSGTVAADDYMATNFKNIFVCGDVTGPYQFTHMAAHQAYFACINSLFSPFTRWLPGGLKRKLIKVNYDVVPWATYTDPEVATVGLTESTAKKHGVRYELTTYGIDDLDRAIVDDEDFGLVKVLTKPGSDRILGATIVGAHASELIAEFILAMKHGLGLNAILGTTHIYPTMSEANKYLAGNWKKARKPESVLRQLEKFHSWRRQRWL